MGYIYLIHQEETDFWKIGRTKKPLERIKKHRNSNVGTLGYTALFEVENDVAAERVLFRMLKDYRHDQREFFELPIDELRKIEKRIIGIKTVYYSQKFLDIIKEEN